jgi:DNA-binding beta-propeller fold protein YncE
MLALIAGGAGVAVWLAGGNDAAGGGSATNSHSNSLLSTPARSSSSSAISATSAAPAPPINFAASPQTIPLSGFPTVGVLSPDRKKLYIAAESGTAAASTLHIVDTATLKVTNVSTPRPINAISPTADGKSLFLSMSEFADQSGWVAKMDLRTHAMQVVARSTNPEGIALSRDGSLLYFVDDTDFGRIFVVSTTAPFHVSHTLDIGADPHAVVITADGGYVAVDNHGDNTIGVLNTKTNQVTKLKHYAIGLLPESGSTIITTFINGSHSQIVKLDVKTGKVTKIGPASESLVPVATLEVHDRYLYALATQPDYVVTLNVSTGAMTKTALPAKEVAQDLVIDPVTGTGFVIDYNDGGNARGQMLVYRS